MLGKHPADFLFCDSCGFLGAADAHWLEEAYSSAIALMDTGVATRNVNLVRRCAPVVYKLLGRERAASAPCLDFAAGYGLFTRLMRDVGFNFLWTDKHSENLFARGFEFTAEAGTCAVVTAFEVLEHVVDPLVLIDEVRQVADPDHMIFTTELFKGEPPDPDSWWYYAFETGQHVAFYQRRTLLTVAQHFGMEYASAGGLHVLSRTGTGTALQWARRPLRSPAHWWVKRRLTSKTMEDFRLVQSHLRQRGNDASEPN